MRVMLVAAALLVAGSAWSPTWAQDDQVEAAYSEAFHACLASAKATVETEKCTIAERDRQKARLDQVYARRLSSGNATGQAALKASQEAWAKDSAARCETYRGLRGHWGAVRFVSCQLAEVTRRRLALERGDL